MYSLIAEYERWNKYIFNEIFNSENEEKEILFCVDEDLIRKIGKKYFEYDENSDSSIKSFCRSVASLIYDKEKEQIYFKPEIVCKLKENIPYQTGILALFVFVASKMERGENFSSRAYYRHLFTLLTEEDGYDNKKSFTSWLYNHFELVFNSLWERFEDYINEHTKFKIHFPKKRNIESKKKSFIAAPIYHSLLSNQDRRILFDLFNEYSFKYDKTDEQKFKNYFLTWYKNNKLSSRATNHLNDTKMQNEILERIFKLYNDWDGSIYSEFANQLYKKAFPLRLSLKYDYGKINLFLIVEAKYRLKNISEIELYSFQK